MIGTVIIQDTIGFANVAVLATSFHKQEGNNTPVGATTSTSVRDADILIVKGHKLLWYIKWLVEYLHT